MDSGFRGSELGLTAVSGEATIILSGLAPRFKFDPAPGFEPKLIGRPMVILLRVGKRAARIAEWLCNHRPQFEQQHIGHGGLAFGGGMERAGRF